MVTMGAGYDYEYGGRCVVASPAAPVLHSSMAVLRAAGLPLVVATQRVVCRRPAH